MAPPPFLVGPRLPATLSSILLSREVRKCDWTRANWFCFQINSLDDSDNTSCGKKSSDD